MNTKMVLAEGVTALTVVRTDVSIRLSPHFSMTANGLEWTGRPSIEECGVVGVTLSTAERGIQFAIGDFANYVEDVFGEEASQIIDYSEGWSESTLFVYKWMAKNVKLEHRRMDRLSVQHHLAVATLPEPLQTKWLTEAAADREDRPWTVRRMKDAIRVNGDAPETGWWLQVLCQSAADQQALQTALEQQGRIVKLLTSRRKP